jgi:hypothetical protein
MLIIDTVGILRVWRLVYWRTHVQSPAGNPYKYNFIYILDEMNGGTSEMAPYSINK